MKKHLLAALLLVLVSLPCSAKGELEQLLANGDLTIDSRLDHRGTLVPGQRAKMVIEIATNNWFSGGTRIRLPEVPGLVILQTDPFAANASETRSGATWVVQRWTVDLYPQRAGDFLVPPMTLMVNVNGGELGNIEGETESPALQFSVSMPEALEQADFWVASPDYRVTQKISRATNALQPGDAFERIISFEASDVLAMMLPEVRDTRQPGLAVYPAPPQLENSNNRGQSRGKRVQSISYLAEKPGSYLLPAQDFFWWNTRAETLQVISIPAIEVQVAGEAGQSASGSSREGKSPHWPTLIGAALSLLGIVVFVVLMSRYRPWRYLTALVGPVQSCWQRLLALRKPALPRGLNPDNSAGD